jgi:hypothetical protein
MTQMTTLSGERRRYGPAYIFVMAPGGCTDLKVIQYIERTDTLLNASGKTVQKSTMGPGIDGGIPYSPQGTIGGNLVSQDAPGISGPAGSTDQQMASGDLDLMEKQLGVRPGLAVSATRAFKYWTYEICLKPNY